MISSALVDSVPCIYGSETLAIEASSDCIRLPSMTQSVISVRCGTVSWLPDIADQRRVAEAFLAVVLAREPPGQGGTTTLPNVRTDAPVMLTVSGIGRGCARSRLHALIWISAVALWRWCGGAVASARRRHPPAATQQFHESVRIPGVFGDGWLGGGNLAA